VAVALRDWLPSVIQAIEPWVSAEDIEKGSRWSTKIAEELQATKAGIICVTADNQNSAWLLFEADALSKTVEKEKEMVCTYLFNIKPTDVTGPLEQFQATESTKEDSRRLVATLNKAQQKPLPDSKLADAFDVWWEQLDKKLKAIVLSPSPTHSPKRDISDMVEELLTRGREQSRTVEAMGLAVSQLHAVVTNEIYYGGLSSLAKPGLNRLEHLVALSMRQPTLSASLLNPDLDSIESDPEPEIDPAGESNLVHYIPKDAKPTRLPRGKLYSRK